MTTATLTSRFERWDPFKLDTLIAVGLTLLVWLQLFFLTAARPAFIDPSWVRPGPRVGMLLAAQQQATPDWLAYVLAAGVFLPLIIRREVPWLSLVLSGGFATVYALAPLPPAFTLLGPMIAIYSVAAYSKQRHSGLAAVLIGGLIVAAVVFGFTSNVRGAMEIIGAFVMLAAAAFLGDTARSRRDYVAEVEARALAAEQAREEETLRRLEEERIGIAREVHDIVAHSLSIVAVQASAAEAVLDDEPGQARESLQSIRATSTEALGELRSVLDVLRTGTDSAPREPSADLKSLESLAKPVREAGLGVQLDVTGDIGSVPAYASVSAYRIVQESLTNIVRHARADTAQVGIQISRDSLEIEVTDDGRGVDARSLEATDGHGIRGMSERVEALGGSFSAGPRDDGSGFRVAATIPLAGS
jgi:signal transduction histidine kinase